MSQVLQILQNLNLQIKLEKSIFYTKEVEYLGYIISEEGVKMDPNKIRTILEWLLPRSVSEVQFFLKFANFYRRFIQGYLMIARKLMDLIKQDTLWV